MMIRAMSNRITMILANLGTHKEDPLERLAIVRRSVQNAKEKFQTHELKSNSKL